MREDLTRADLTDAVDHVVNDLLDRHDVLLPPVDTLLLAQRAGTSLDARRPQSHWAAAMALWPAMAPALFARLGIGPEERRGLPGESLPELFARRLLVPTRWLRDEAAACGGDLLALIDRFATAPAVVMAWRLLDLPEPCFITLIDNGRVSQRRGNAARPPRELSDAERQCQDYVHRYSRPFECHQGAWRVRGWPLHEADWKREVLQSMVEEGALE